MCKYLRAQLASGELAHSAQYERPKSRVSHLVYTVDFPGEGVCIANIQAFYLVTLVPAQLHDDTDVVVQMRVALADLHEQTSAPDEGLGQCFAVSVASKKKPKLPLYALNLHQIEGKVLCADMERYAPIGVDDGKNLDAAAKLGIGLPNIAWLCVPYPHTRPYLEPFVDLEYSSTSAPSLEAAPKPN